jgi:trehalose-6-phosphatase
LLDIAPTPHAVYVDATLLNLLRRVFIGDDTTDLDGFAAMKRFNGLAIALGSRIPGERRLAGPRDVRAWLESLLAA